MATGLVTLRCGPATALDLRAVPQAIREAGFKPRDMGFVANGRFSDGGAQFTPDGWTDGLRLADTLSDAPAEMARLEARLLGWESEPVRLTLSSVSLHE